MKLVHLSPTARWCHCVLTIAVAAVSTGCFAAGDAVYVGKPLDKADTPYLAPFWKKAAGPDGRGAFSAFRVVNGIDNLTRRDLEGASLVIVGGSTTYELSDHDRAVKDTLVEYVRRGGGLVILNTFWQMFAQTEFPVQLMKAFGGTVLYEGVVTPQEYRNQIGEWSPDKWAVTTQVAPEFAEGVKKVLYRTPYRQNWEHGVTPFLPTKEWKAALKGEKYVKSIPFETMGLDMLDRRVRPHGFDGETPIIGVREFGKGRVVWFGIGQLLDRVVAPDDRANNETVERILEKGTERTGPVDTGRFLRNLFGWAAANAGEVDCAELPELRIAAEMDRALGTDYRIYRGVVGARTTLSSGRSTPEQFIARAKALGHDYIVFLEDFAKLTPENYEKLRDICRRATDGGFSAWPGFEFSKDNGNRQFVFAKDPLYPGRMWLSDSGHEFISMWKNKPENGWKAGADGNFAGSVDLGYFYGMLSFNSNRGWHRLKKSPYRSADVCNAQSIGVVTRVDGETVERDMREYVDNMQQGYQLWPFALELTGDAGTIGEGTYLNYCGANGLAEFRRIMLEWGINSGIAGRANFGMQSFSNGPVVEFRPRRANYSGDRRLLYSEEFLRWPYTLKVTSGKGIDTVEIRDSGKVLRRWRANGAKTFETSGSFACERQHYLWVRAKDVEGGEAVTRSADAHTFILRETVCSDRNNQLFYSDQTRPDGTHQIGNYSGETALPNHILWYPRLKPVGYFVLDRKYGVGEQSVFDGCPEDHPQLWLAPSIEYGGTPSKNLGWLREFVAGKEGGPHNFPRRIVASSDALVGERVLDGVLAHGREPLTHGCQGLHPVQDSEYADTVARTTFFVPKPDGITAYQWEQTLTLKREVPSAKGKSIVKWGNVAASTRAEYVDAVVDGKRIADCRNRSFTMKKGDFLVIKNPVYGSMAVYPLSPVRFDRMALTVEGSGETYPAGTVFRLDLVAVGMHRFVTDPFALAGEAAEFYGIGRKGPGYKAELEAGKGTPNGVCFDAVAENGVLYGRFSGLMDFPGTLGLRLSGLDDEQAAVVESAAGTRLVASVGGTAHIALRNEESDGPVFIGHPFVTAERKLVVSLSKLSPKTPWQVEFHNPGGKPLKAKVRTDPRFSAFSFDETVELAAGTSKTFILR